jgi:hypothetical protein
MQNNPFNALNGVRAISMIWIIYGHTGNFLSQPALNKTYLHKSIMAVRQYLRPCKTAPSSLPAFNLAQVS